MKFFRLVMPGLDPGIHAFSSIESKTWMAGTSPAMTRGEFNRTRILPGATKLHCWSRVKDFP